MTKQVLYTYLGTNGTICSPVLLEDIYHIKKYRLIAAPGKRLTKDGKTYHDTVPIPQTDLPLSKEVAAQK